MAQLWKRLQQSLLLQLTLHQVIHLVLREQEPLHMEGVVQVQLLQLLQGITLLTLVPLVMTPTVTVQ